MRVTDITPLSVSREDVKALFCRLPRDAHKGMLGRVLVICGSYDGNGISMSGAAYFAASAAYRCGAGIVEIFTPRKNYEALAANIPEAVFCLYECKERLSDICDRVRESIGRADCVVIGCGLGRSDVAKEILRTTLSDVSCPLVIDADALNMMAEDGSLWSLLSKKQRERTVITPHAGEMSRLCGKSVVDILSETPKTALTYAAEKGIVCLLKHHNTSISDGKTLYVNHSGNAGMASGGMGDVLAGVTGALLARDISAEGSTEHDDVLYRVAVAAYLHGLAGDGAAERLGEYSLMASDVVSEIPEILKAL